MTTKLGMNYVPAIDYCEAVIDGTHDSPKQVEDGRKLVTSKNIVGGKLDLENCYNISEKDFEQINKRSKVYEWDILMSMIGTVGEICILKDEPDYAIKNVGVFRARSESDAKWLYYYLTSPSAQFDIYSRLRGSTQKFLPLGELRNFPILKPENEEIKLKIINQLYSIDCLISCKERLNEKVSELISALFRSWFIDFDPVKAKAEGKLPYGMDEETAALFPDTFENSELGPIPTGWAIGKIGDIANLKSGYAFKSKDFVFDSKKKVLKIKDLKGHGKIDFSALASIDEVTTNTTRVQFFKLGKGDIVVAMSGNTTGKIGIMPESDNKIFLNQRVGKFFLKNNIFSTFLYFFLISGNYEKSFFRMGYGSAHPNINPSQVENIKIIIPPMKIIDNFTKLSDAIVNDMLNNDSTIRTIVELRNILLSGFMSGELSVS